MREAGLTVRLDTAGNIIGRREGSEPDLPVIMFGSHIDSVPGGGNYDGDVGVIGAIEVIQLLQENGIRTRHPLEVVSFTDEEGGLTGSRAMIGKVDYRTLSVVSHSGMTIGEGIRAVGGDPNRLDLAERKPGELKAFIELHIEQGPILEAEGKMIGVVTHGQGLSWTQVTITGRESHTGSTPMPMRKNAGLGMARILELVDQIAWAHKPDAVGAAGHIDVFPNSRNVIPGRVFVTIDFRHPEDSVLAAMDEEMRAGVEKIADDIGLEYEIEQIFYYAPVPFEESCVAAVREAARECGHSAREIVSGAGHDACYLANVAPTAMVFIPCIDGISHNEIEDVKPEWITAGADVLLRAILEKAGHAG